MKALLLIVILLLVCIVIFVAAVLSPRRSKSMQESYEDLSKKAEGKSDESGGRAGDVTRGALAKGREAVDASARAGRRVNEKATRE